MEPPPAVMADQARAQYDVSSSQFGNDRVRENLESAALISRDHDTGFATANDEELLEGDDGGRYFSASSGIDPGKSLPAPRSNSGPTPPTMDVAAACSSGDAGETENGVAIPRRVVAPMHTRCGCQAFSLAARQSIFLKHLIMRRILSRFTSSNSDIHVYIPANNFVMHGSAWVTASSAME